MYWVGLTYPLAPSLPQYNPTGLFLLGLCKGPGIPPKSWEYGWTSCTKSTVWLLLWQPRCWKIRGVKSNTVWTFCELQMGLTLRCTQLDELFFQLKQINSLYLVYSCVLSVLEMWWINCGHCLHTGLGIQIHSHRQQCDLINLLLFFQIRKVGYK
jgi:hypothetical protein